MKQQIVQLIDPTGQVVATAQVADEGGRFGGSIDLEATPPEMRALFVRFDELVNGQVFSLLDEIEDRIAGLGLRARLEGGIESSVEQLQIHPSTGDVSFRLGIPVAVNGISKKNGRGTR
jgi:hypothetical protein